MNLRGLDSKSMVDVKERTAQYAKLASFMNADPDEIGKGFSAQTSFPFPSFMRMCESIDRI